MFNPYLGMIGPSDSYFSRVENLAFAVRVILVVLMNLLGPGDGL